MVKVYTSIYYCRIFQGRHFREPLKIAIERPDVLSAQTRLNHLQYFPGIVSDVMWVVVAGASQCSQCSYSNISGMLVNMGFSGAYANVKG